MTSASAIYLGAVMHRRLRPRRHRFRYRAFWMLLDLAELPALGRRLRLFSYNAPNIFSFYETDHGDGGSTPLQQQVRRQLEQARIDIGAGRILLLCMPRTLGYSFNPLSIFFCYRDSGELAAVLYQVHNTFGERHTYLVETGSRHAAARHAARKLLYVSPFMPMDVRYDFRLSGPGERLTVGIVAGGTGGPILAAAVNAERRSLTDSTLLRMLVLMPAVTVKVIAAIHWQALRIWLKRIPPVSRGESGGISRNTEACGRNGSADVI